MILNCGGYSDRSKHPLSQKSEIFDSSPYTGEPFTQLADRCVTRGTVGYARTGSPRFYTGAHKKVIPKLRLWHLSDGVGKQDN